MGRRGRRRSERDHKISSWRPDGNQSIHQSISPSISAVELLRSRRPPLRSSFLVVLETKLTKTKQKNEKRREKRRSRSRRRNARTRWRATLATSLVFLSLDARGRRSSCASPFWSCRALLLSRPAGPEILPSARPPSRRLPLRTEKIFRYRQRWRLARIFPEPFPEPFIAGSGWRTLVPYSHRLLASLGTAFPPGSATNCSLENMPSFSILSLYPLASASNHLSFPSAAAFYYPPRGPSHFPYLIHDYIILWWYLIIIPKLAWRWRDFLRSWGCILRAWEFNPGTPRTRLIRVNCVDRETYLIFRNNLFVQSSRPQIYNKSDLWSSDFMLSREGSCMPREPIVCMGFIFMFSRMCPRLLRVFSHKLEGLV